MKKAFRLVGLDCANCAAKIERKVAAIAGVSEATVNFMTTKLSMEFDDVRKDEILAAMETMVHAVEPDVEIKKA